MAKIKTRNELREYMLRQMGAPTLKVELTEDQLNDCIDKAIERFSEYAYDGTIEASLLVELTKGQMKYKLPDNVVAVSGLKSSSVYSTFINIPAGYSLAMNPISLNYMDNVSTIDVQSMTERMAKMSTLRSLFDVSPNFNFNHNTKDLTFFEEPMSSVALLEIALEYEPNEESDNIFGHQWIKTRAIGEAMVLWSTVTGKYTSNLVNGTSINYSDIQSKGEAMIAESEEELDGIGEPLGVYIF